MALTKPELLERDVRAHCDEGDYDRAATKAIEGYGPEIYAFLAGFHRSEQHAADVFSLVCEQLWRGLPAFAWACSLRTWAYTIARQASAAHLRGEKRRAANVPLSGHVSSLAAEVRTRTAEFARTENKDKIARLREALPEEDRMLLVLRIDREMAWSDVAQVMLGADGAADAAVRTREAARLRKRFQLVKERLVELGRREGLLPKRGGD